MTQLASDNFTRSNSATLGANWTVGTSSPESFQIVSNTCRPGNLAHDEWQYYSAITWPNDQYSEVTFSAVDATASIAGQGVVVRGSSGAWQYYKAIGSAAGYLVTKRVAGTGTQLTNSTATTFAAGDVLRLTVVGTSLTLTKNGTTIWTGTDSSIASGSAGLSYSSASTSVALSLWAGGSGGSATLVGVSGSAGAANVTSTATRVGIGSGSMGVASLYDPAATAFISNVGASGSLGVLNLTIAGIPTGPPTITGPIPNQTSVVGTFVTPLDVSGLFSGETSWAVTAGLLPPGINLAGSVFSGKPTVPGVYAGIIVTASNAFGSISQGPFTWTIQSLPADIFPSYLPGLTWDIVRQPTWKTGYQEALSGKASTTAYQKYPLWEWELHFSVLRDTLLPSEIRTLVGFFNSMKGRYGSFRFFDPDFNTVTAEPFGTGDGLKNAFQLIANYAVAGGPGSPDIIQNLANTPNLYDNGVLINPALYSIGVTGIVTFTGAPVINHALTWSGSFYYRCRFLDDAGMAPSQFMYRLWELQSLRFRSVVL